MDSSTFQLKRQEIQKRLEMRRFTLESWQKQTPSNGTLKNIFATVAELDIMGLGKMVGVGRLIGDVAGVAVPFLLTRWARKVFK